jgi:hypothetical protein
MAQSVQNPAYDAYHLYRCRKRASGLYQMPTAGPTPTASVVVRLHSACEQEVVVYAAKCRGKPPSVPAAAPDVSNTNRVMLAGEQCANIAVEDIDGSMMYYLSGWARYAIIESEGLDGNFNTGKTPWQLTLDYIPGTTYNPALLNWSPLTPEGNQPALPRVYRPNG